MKNMIILRQKIYNDDEKSGIKQKIYEILRDQIDSHSKKQSKSIESFRKYQTNTNLGKYPQEKLDKISDENNALVVPNDIDSDYSNRLCHQHVDKNQRIKLSEDVQKYMKRKGKMNATEFIYGSDNNTPLSDYLHEMGHANNSVGKSKRKKEYF